MAAGDARGFEVEPGEGRDAPGADDDLVHDKLGGDSSALETNQLFGAAPFRYYDLGGLVAGVELATGAPPTADIIALLDDTRGGPVPRAMGVGVAREWYVPTAYFGFAEDTRPGVRGFGEIGNPSVGGAFAELF